MPRCDGIDDDCNGAVDEDYVALPTACGVGRLRCDRQPPPALRGSVVDSCAAGTPAADDATCNGIDDDCNGAMDEDYVPCTTACGIGACAATGSTSCAAGVVSSTAARRAPPAADDSSATASTTTAAARWTRTTSPGDGLRRRGLRCDRQRPRALRVGRDSCVPGRSGRR